MVLIRRIVSEINEYRVYPGIWSFQPALAGTFALLPIPAVTGYLRLSKDFLI